jgi:glycine cleavage system transcriptional repressor
MPNGTKEGNKEYVVLSVMGQDRPGIVASVSQALYQNRYNIEALSQNAIMGQFAMILIASAPNGSAFAELKKDCDQLIKAKGLDIHLRKTLPEEMVPYRAGETEPFVITVHGEDRPGLAYGISEVLAEWEINITNLDARVAMINQKLEYIQVYEVDIPKDLDFSIVQEKLRAKGEQMKVTVDLQHRGVFRAINQI